MKVVLISPPYGNIYGSFQPALKVGFLNPPLGLCYLAACLQRVGHNVKIIDAEAQDYGYKDIVKAVKSPGRLAACGDRN